MQLRRYVWLAPTLVAGIAALPWTPLAAPAALVLLCYFPGLLVVRAAKLAGDWDSAGRVVLTAAASLAVAPVLLNPVWHATNAGWALLAYTWLLLQLGWWLWGRARLPDAPAAGAARTRLFDSVRTRVACALLAALVVLATIGPYWPTELAGYPVPALIHDFIKHHAVLFSLEQQPLPLRSPFYASGPGAPVYYYHFFYLIPATVRAIAGGPSIELAFGVQSALSGIMTAAMFYLIVKRFTGGDGPATLAALLSTAVGALDIVPVLLRGVPVVTLDAWADHVVRIHSFLNQMIWSPQNVSGVTILLLGVYILSRRGWCRGWLVVGPLLGAGLVGASIWVGAATWTGAACYAVVEAVRNRQRRMVAARRLAAAGVVGLLMLAAAAPSLRGYAEMARRHGQSLTTEWPYQWNALLGRLVSPGIGANLLDLPWVLVLELGPLILFPLLLPRAVWRRAWQDPGLRLLLICAVVALAGFPVVRSQFTYNDFGQKTMMAAMAAGVVLGSALLDPRRGKPTLLNPLGWSLGGAAGGRRRRKTAWFVGLTLLAGLPVGLYEAPLTAVRRYLPQSGPLARFAHPIARRAAREAGAYRFLRYQLPRDAVVLAYRDGRQRLVQIARRPLGVTVLQEDTQVFYPADAAGHARCLAQLGRCLTEPGSAEECYQTLRRYRITHVLVGDLERRAWTHVAKLDDARHFRRVYASAAVSIFALE